MYASFSPYNYCLNNPVLLIDPDGRAPENIIIGIKANTGTSHGHATIAVEEYANDGSKTGNVIVYDLAATGSEGEAGLKFASIFALDVDATYTSVTMPKDEFLNMIQGSVNGEPVADGIVEIETTKDQDEKAHLILSNKEKHNVKYNPVSNNCATHACHGLRGVTKDQDFGKESATAKVKDVGIVTHTFATPNEVFNDASNLPGATILKNSPVTKTKIQEYVDYKSRNK